MSKYTVELDKAVIIGNSSVGNKAYNLAILSSKATWVNIPKSIILMVHPTSESKIATMELIDYTDANIGYPVIARSSTTVEDSTDSFAGIFLSQICNNKDELFDAVADVKACILSDKVKGYCVRKSIDVTKISVAVLVQQYINADMSGVFFTKHPLTNDDNIIYIEYKENSSDAVTSGSSAPRTAIISKDCSEQYEPLMKHLREIAIVSEKLYGYPVDIEWILSEDKLWVVQVRQITT